MVRKPASPAVTNETVVVKVTRHRLFSSDLSSCGSARVQVGGSASASRSTAGFLRPTWSLWTDQTRPRMPSPTTKARDHVVMRRQTVGASRVLTASRFPAGEMHVTISAYKAEQEDEISLDIGETTEVIHKLLDGWWVVR